MAKLTLNSITTQYLAAARLNANSASIVAAIDNTVSRDGTAPNEMMANLDMNSNRVINLPDPASDSEPATVGYLVANYGAGASTFATQAAASAAAALASQQAASISKDTATSAALAAAQDATDADNARIAAEAAAASITYPISVVNGGTGSTTAANARTALGITPANIGAAPLASPALTGNPTAPTAAVLDNDTSIATTAFVQQELTGQAVKLTGNQTIAGVKTFSSTPVFPAQSMVRVHTQNGSGSTNTAVRRFVTTVTSTGPDITYTDSATLGSSFTINTNGVYSISYADSSSAPVYVGLSLNSSQLSTSIDSITQADKLIYDDTSANNEIGSVTWVGYLPSGSVVRPHGQPPMANSAATGRCMFTIVRVS